MNLHQKIASRQAVVAVIGLGYVGLPVAVVFAQAGFRVIGLDIDEERIEAINRGESYISDVPASQIAALATPGRLSGTTDCNVLHKVDAAIICVPTPLDKAKEPDLSCIIAATDAISLRLHRDMLIVLESTTYPGTTEELVLPRLLAGAGGQSGLAVGRDFYLGFSPERIDPGRKDFAIHNTPKVISGVTPQCTAMAQALYSCAMERVVPVSSPRVAEMVKLLENTFRAVNIALVNEVAIMCNRLGIDVWEVIEAAETKPFGFMPFYPGPGLGGHCIPIDPQYLAWKLKTLNYNARFIQLAAEVNFGMPRYVLSKIAEALLAESRKTLEGSRVLILGVAYKADVSDLRESPALDLIHLLQEAGSHVSYHDPYVPRLLIDGVKMTCVDLDQDALRTADCVVITTAHSTYDWDWVAQSSRLLVDTRNATRGVTANPVRIVKL